MELFQSDRFPAWLHRNTLDAERLILKRRPGPPTPLPPRETLRFGHQFSDHILEVDWNAQDGWQAPVIRPFGHISVHPAASCLHYGLEVFEGLKAFVDPQGEIQIFRPNMNIKRLFKSSVRMALPAFNEDEALKLIAALLEVDREQIPSGDGFSMYIRPVMFSTQPTLGVGPPGAAKLMVMLSPVGPYLSCGFKPVSLFSTTEFVRAFKGGVGDCKVGGNYGPTIMPHQWAMSEGFNQILWLTPDAESGDFFVTEGGTMNFFMLWRNHEGDLELVTAPLVDNLILPGITRDSLLTLAKTIPNLKVSEKRILMRRDLLKGHEENQVFELFGAGTAAVVAPINEIGFEGTKYKFPIGEGNVGAEAGVGPIGQLLLSKLNDIQYGRSGLHEWLFPLQEWVPKCLKELSKSAADEHLSKTANPTACASENVSVGG